MLISVGDLQSRLFFITTELEFPLAIFQHGPNQLLLQGDLRLLCADI